MKKYILEIIVFICGANLMIFELVGSRLLAPYLGSEIFVWSSIIGVILGSLSIGYWLGGKISDKKATISGLSTILIFLATSVGLIIFYQDILLLSISSFFNLRSGAILASIVLFSPSSILFGIISPYAVSLKLKEINRAGSTVGNLYAISTGGSIFGTFLAGFFLIPAMGSTNIIIMISGSLFALSIITFFKNSRHFSFFILFLCVLFFYNKLAKINISASEVNEDVDTQYGRIMIYDIKNSENKLIRVLKTNPMGAQSNMLIEKPKELMADYFKFYDLAEHFNPQFKEVVLLGGGGYSYPKHFLEKNKNAKIDVVEIDPSMTELARKYFFLEDDPRMRIFHEDARVFLNKNNKKYDVIFKDTFNFNHSVPFHLTTKEFLEKEKASLNEGGVVFVNIIASISDNNKFLNLEYNTYKEVFEDVFLFKVKEKLNDKILQNVILVATKNKTNKPLSSNKEDMADLLKNKIEVDFKIKEQILTDDFAPVEYH